MRIRTIKPEFWTSLTIGELDYATKLTFIGLWNYADDEGRGIDDARLIKAAIWPLDLDMNTDAVDLAMTVLGDIRLISRYEAGGLRYFSICNWKEHQAISKPRPSRLPEPSSREGKGKEGNREGKGTDNHALRAVPDTKPDNDQLHLVDVIWQDFRGQELDQRKRAKIAQRLNNAYGRPAVTNALRELHGFPPEQAVRSPYAYLVSMLKNREAS